MLLVSIVGDFHSSIFPIYNEFKEKIDHHLVVDDDAFSERNKHKKIVESLKKFNDKHNLDITTQAYTIDEDSLQSIAKLVTEIEQIEPDPNKIFINITDGLANIGIALAAKLLPKGVRFISYDMHENSYNITTQNDIQNFEVNSSLSIEDHFLLKGLKILQKGDKDFAHRHQSQILELFNTYVDEFELLKKDMSHKNSYGINESKYPRALQLVQNMEFDMEKDVAKITGGLFEYYVYLLLKDMGFDDIEIGVKIEQPITNDIGVENEFDILLMKNNHLHMIECKFKQMDKDTLLNFVYKYMGLIGIIDDESRMMIVTNEPTYRHNIFDPNNKSLSNYRRAYLHKIALRGSIIRHKQEFLDEIQTFFL